MQRNRVWRELFTVAAVYEAVNELAASCNPLLEKEGWSLTHQVTCERHSVCAFGAATPPQGGGESRLLFCRLLQFFVERVEPHCRIDAEEPIHI
jgi:hypothetical protein